MRTTALAGLGLVGALLLGLLLRAGGAGEAADAAPAAAAPQREPTAAASASGRPSSAPAAWPPARPREAAPSAPAPTRIRVVVRLPAGAVTAAPPVPELLHLDGRGSMVPVDSGTAPRGRSLAELARRAAEPAAAEASRTFEVVKPGRYLAAWHLWLQVPGTRTWRVQRGRGPEVVVAEHGGERELRVVIDVGAAELELDPALDARAPDARYTFTAKDGD